MKISALLLSMIVCNTVYCQPVQTETRTTTNDTAYVYKQATRDGTGKYYFGREIARIMGASGSAWLDRTSRPSEENTEAAIGLMQLKSEMTVADIGAGTGYYTFRVATRVPKGRVYAVEIQDELITILNNRKKERRAGNIEVIKGDTLSVNLPANSVDVVFLVDVYHELSWPREIMNSIERSLKNDGRIILIEYKGEDPDIRIKPLHKTTVAQLTREMAANGYELERREDGLPIQHLLVFRKKHPRFSNR